MILEHPKRKVKLVFVAVFKIKYQIQHPSPMTTLSESMSLNIEFFISMEKIMIFNLIYCCKNKEKVKDYAT